jgi:hypothetical protein
MKNYDILREVEDSPPPKWRIFWARKPGKKKYRRLCVPVGKKMKEILNVLKSRVKGLSGEMPSATGFRDGISILDSVCRHQSRFRKTKVFNRFIVILDLKNAYRSVDAVELTSVLAKINPRQFSGYLRTKKFIEGYCLDPEYGGVAMGAPSSNDLFNVYCEYVIDQKLRLICKEFGLTYTRYVDDLMFSSRHVITTEIRRRLRQVLTDAGFRINDKKAKVYDLRKGPVVVNGIGITYEGRTFLPREILISIRGKIHCALKGEPVNLYKIHGLMGVYKNMTDLSKLNSTEKAVLEAYQKLQGMSPPTKTNDTDESSFDIDDWDDEE